MNPDLPSDDGFWVLADSYRDAAVAVHTTIRSGSYIGMAATPLIFLCFRSIELALKAVLVHHNCPEKIIRNQLGHKIEALLTECKKHTNLPEIGIDSTSEACLRKHSEDYSRKWFEYSEDFWSGPDIDMLLELCNTVCNSTRSYK